MIRALVGALVLGICAWVTQGRAQVWRSNEALWTAAVAVTPTKPRPLVNLAAAYARQGRAEEADRWLHRALTTRRLTLAETTAAERLHTYLCVTADRCCASLSLPP